VCEDLRQICVNLNTSEALEQICMLFLFFVCLWWLQKNKQQKTGKNCTRNRTAATGRMSTFAFFPPRAFQKLLHTFLRRIVLVCPLQG